MSAVKSSSNKDKIPLANIRIDGSDTQVLAKINEQAIEDYAQAMQTGSVFPPIILYHDGTRYFVADGFHRVLAAARIKLTEIAAEVRAGTATDALWLRSRPTENTGCG
jgi:ParB-like chromosome segregation protein Spo0J